MNRFGGPPFTWADCKGSEDVTPEDLYLDWLDEQRRQGEAETAGPLDPDELVRWAEMYGHPEVWAKKAQELHAKVERLQAQIRDLEDREAA